MNMVTKPIFEIVWWLFTLFDEILVVTAVGDEPGLDDPPEGIVGPSEVDWRVDVDLPHSFDVRLENTFLSNSFLLKHLVTHVCVLVEKILFYNNP